MIIIYLQSLIMIRKNTGPTKVLLTEPLLTVMILGMGNPCLTGEAIFSSKMIGFFFSFNRKMLSGYCVENSQSF